MKTYPTYDWYGCYGKNWKNIAVPAATRHPAKFSNKLINRIYHYLFAHGYVSTGDWVFDPFGGTALGAEPATRLRLNWVGIELEQHFVDIGAGMDCPGFTAKVWKRLTGRTERSNYSHGIRLCPDCVTALDADRGREKPTPRRSWRHRAALMKTLIENNKFKLEMTRGEMPSERWPIRFPENKTGIGKSLNPLGVERLVPTQSPHRYAGNLGTWAKNPLHHGTAVLFHGDSRQLDKWLNVLARVLVSSPPFGDASTRDRNKLQKGAITEVMARTYTQTAQGVTSGNLATLKTTPLNKQHLSPVVLSSPPYGNGVRGGGTIEGTGARYDPVGHPNDPQGNNTMVAYGESEENLGNQDDETFWTAALEIVQKSYDALPIGGKAVWVTKRMVRKGEIFEFSKMWQELCHSVGFETIAWAKAWLIEPRGIQRNMFGDDVDFSVERKGMFRRLAEKNGSPRIDWEDVIIMEKV